MTPSGIEPATLRLVAQRLKHLPHRIPSVKTIFRHISIQLGTDDKWQPGLIAALPNFEEDTFRMQAQNSTVIAGYFVRHFLTVHKVEWAERHLKSPVFSCLAQEEEWNFSSPVLWFSQSVKALCFWVWSVDGLLCATFPSAPWSKNLFFYSVIC